LLLYLCNVKYYIQGNAADNNEAKSGMSVGRQTHPKSREETMNRMRVETEYGRCMTPGAIHISLLELERLLRQSCLYRKVGGNHGLRPQ
jgi:hypothetical protein